MAKTRSLVINIVAYASFVPILESFFRQLAASGFLAFPNKLERAAGPPLQRKLTRKRKNDLGGQPVNLHIAVRMLSFGEKPG